MTGRVDRVARRNAGEFMNFKKMYEEETLAGSAVTVFASALLVLMAPQWSNRILNLPLNAITAGLIVFSMILALTSVVPPLRSRVFRAVQCLSLSIGIAALVVFIVGWVSGWISVKQVMPSAQWMSWFVLVGGFSLYLLLVYGIVKGHLQRLRQQIMSGVGRIPWGRLRAWTKWRGFARGCRETDKNS